MNHSGGISARTELRQVAGCSPCLAFTIQLSAPRRGVLSPLAVPELQGWGAALCDLECK